MTRRRPVTGNMKAEAQYNVLGEDFCNDRQASYNYSVRTKVQLFVPGSLGSSNKVKNFLTNIISLVSNQKFLAL